MTESDPNANEIINKTKETILVVELKGGLEFLRVAFSLTLTVAPYMTIRAVIRNIDVCVPSMCRYWLDRLHASH